MKEVVLTASVLILALILFRFLFRTAIPRRVQYALWALVLVRLLVPVQLPALPVVSVLDVSQQAGQQLTAVLERPVEVSTQPAAEPIPDNTQTQVIQNIPNTAETSTALPASTLSLAQVLDVVWKVGMVTMAAFFLIANLRFRLRLKKSRVPFPVEGCPLPVYLSDRLSSPCLVGLVRPAIYLTPAAVQSDRLDYVLLHERTHAKHLDPLWALLRCVCLTIYWFHPLVWAAALLSRTDCELACDEGAMAALDHSGRLAYGRTLLALVPVRGRPTNPLLAATTMTSGKRQLKDRITRIAHQKRPILAAVLAAVLLAGLAAACTFSGPRTAVYEDGIFTLSLSDLSPYSAPAVPQNPTIEQHFDLDSYGEGGETPPWTMREGPRSENAGAMLFLQRKQSGSMDGLQETYQLFYYLDLMGTDGFITSYPGVPSERQDEWFYDLFAVDEEGNRSLLAETYGSAGGQLLTQDLNGDGKEELITDRQLLLQWEDTLYAVNYADLLAQRWPAFRTLEGARLSARGSCILLSGTMEDETGTTTSFLRTLTFSGDTLTVAQPASGTGEPVAVPLEELTVYEELSDPQPEPWRESTRFGSNFDDQFYFGIYTLEDGTCVPRITLENDDVVPSFDRLPLGVVSGNRWLDDFPALLGYQGLLAGWSNDSKEVNWTIDLYRWNQEEGLVRFLRAESTLRGNVRILDLNGDGDCELITDRQLFFRRDGTIYTVTYADFLKEHWPAFRSLDTAAADPLDGCVVLAGTCQDENGSTVSFFRQLYLEDSGLILGD